MINPNRVSVCRRYSFIGIVVFSCAMLISGCGNRPVKQPVTNAKEVKSLGAVDQALFDNAVAAMANEQFQAAEKDLKILLTRRHDLEEVWINYALSLYHQSTKQDELRSALKSIQDRNIKLPQSYNLQGMLAVQDGEFKQAEKFYQLALKSDKSYANAWYNLALLNDVYLQNVRKAIEYYQQYITLMPGDEETKSWLEHLQASLGEL